jgi:hypothetical protein
MKRANKHTEQRFISSLRAGAVRVWLVFSLLFVGGITFGAADTDALTLKNELSKNASNLKISSARPGLVVQNHRISDNDFGISHSIEEDTDNEDDHLSSGSFQQKRFLPTDILGLKAKGPSSSGQIIKLYILFHSWKSFLLV